MLKENKMIEREKDVTYIATISGGKDSVTMCDLLLKNGYPVDEIIFSDTLLEFKEMLTYIDKVEEYFLARYKIGITRLKPKSTFEHWAYGTLVGENINRPNFVRGIPTADGMCWWRREAKIKPIVSYVENKYKDSKIVKYIGYTVGENRSVKNEENIIHKYPLKEIFKFTEEDCKAYLINQEMENPLYRHFSRTGCHCCPFQSDRSWFNVWKHHKDVWSFMKDVENRLQTMEDNGRSIVNKYWFMGNKSINEVENDFIFKDKQKSLFDFSDEPLKDCFCKI